MSHLDLKRIKISIDIEPGLVVFGDEYQLKTLFFNIVDNAVKYTREGGDVSIKAALVSGKVRVAVQDSGIGIVSEDIDRIFNRFYRIDKSRTSAGFGLGLSIAKSIADAHSGTITVTSTPRQGSAFTVVLPSSHPA